MFFIICLAFLLISFLAYKIYNRINIVVINCLIWTFLAISVCFLDMPKSINAFFFVLTNMIAFFISYFIVSPKKVESKDIKITDDMLVREEEQVKKFDKINKFVFILNIIGLIYLARYFGFSISNFFNISSLMSKMNAISHMRYSDDSEFLPLITRIINIFVYSSCAYSGFFTVKKFKKEYLYNIILVFFQTLLTNSKATLVFGVAFYASGFLVGTSFFNKKINFKKILIFLVVAIVVILFVTEINYLRHSGNFLFSEEFNKIITSYFIGPFSAFSIWFDNSRTELLDFGSNTFSSIFRLLGISSQKHGEFVNISGVSTNVYTIFKHLINDFSLFGTYIYSIIIGGLSAIIDNKVIHKKRGFIGIDIVIIATILISFFSSLFRYTINVIVCVVIIAAALPIKLNSKGE